MFNPEGQKLISTKNKLESYLNELKDDLYIELDSGLAITLRSDFGRKDKSILKKRT